MLGRFLDSVPLPFARLPAMATAAANFESLWVLGPATLVLLPAAYVYWHRGRRTVLAGAVLWLGFVAATIWLAPIDVKAKTVDRDTIPLEVEDNDYVASKTCRTCHPGQYASWHRSYHRTMTQTATPKSVVGDFGDVSVSGYEWNYHLFKEGDEFLVKITAPDEVKPFRQDLEQPRRVVMTTGSHHMQNVWVESKFRNHVELVQANYLFEERRWVPRQSVFLLPPHRAGQRQDIWSLNCIRCHSTAPQPQMDAHTKVAELGISCEACHGPAEQHLRVNGSPVRRYQLHLGEGDDASIVNPVKLSPRRSSQVCGFCHSHAFHSEAKYEPGKAVLSPFPNEGHGYRPGDELDEHVEIDGHTKYVERGSQLLGRFWPDGMVRGSGREYSDLVQSPCFQGGHEAHQMGCLSCHAMHKPDRDPRSLAVWANDQLKPDMDGDEGCMQCHSNDIPEISAHTHHAAESSGSRCYNCHMPHTTYGLMKAIRAHLNTNPSVQTTLDTQRPNACNLCHLDKSLGWTADHLTEWYGQPTPELSEDQRTVASSILHGLTGRADERVLIAWHMGWEPAVDASDSEWLVPYLAQLLTDPYDVVRYVAERSLRRIEAYRDVSYDWLAPAADREVAAERLRQRWDERREERERKSDPAVLIGGDGGLNSQEFKRLVEQRNDDPIFVEE